MLRSLLKSRLPWVVIAIGLLVALPATAWEIPSADRKTPDVSLAPVGLRLTGQVRREGYPPWNFEIVMHGPDRYYRKEWSGSEDADSGWWGITLILDDFSGYSQQSWSNFGRRGGGSSGRGGKTQAEVARHLFKGGKLVGASPSRLRHPDERAAEEFVALCRRGKLLLPTAIRWVDRGLARDTLYQVEQIELLFQYDAGFFDTVKKRHFRWAR